MESYGFVRVDFQDWSEYEIGYINRTKVGNSWVRKVMKANNIGEEGLGKFGAKVVLEQGMKWLILVILSTNIRIESLLFETDRSIMKL